MRQYKLPRELEGTILERIMEVKLREIAGSIDKLPDRSVKMALERAPEIRSLKRALSRQSPAVIAEIKKSSPSAGVLRQNFDPIALAREYEDSGAAALSVLTEVHHFQGNLEYAAGVRWATRIPILRKDFLVDPYQILESRLAGADAVLLIAALLETAALKQMREEAEQTGMDALVEVHSALELERALEAGATLIGVNSRDLRTFEVSLDVCFDLVQRIPGNAIAVAESGIHSIEDVRRLQSAGYKGFLIGEMFLRAPSPGAALAGLLQGASPPARKAS
jgi:indole-3-glycerol phosphate synthase